MEVKECSKCGKLIQGHNLNEVNWNLMVHSKTHNKIKREEKKHGNTK